MINMSDINALITQWTQRLGNLTYPQAYRDALLECSYELNKLLTNSIDEEIKAREMIDEQQADEYLSSLEAHEHAA